MLLVDVHAHLGLLGSEKEIVAAVERASAAGVKAIVNNSVDAESNRASLELQRQFPVVKAALGLYPTEAGKLTAAEIDAELDFIRSRKTEVAAIGEIGLDYQEAATGEDKGRQQRLFELQIELAKELGKPVIVHSRKAEKEVVETLKKLNCKRVILHAFHGSLNLAKEAADAGFYVTIPSNVGRSSQFQAIAKQLPLSRLMTETDAPYLAAEKGGGSEPAHVAITVKEIARLKGMDEIEVANIIYASYQRLFL